MACYDPRHLIVINEVDVQTAVSNDLQAVELWDYGIGSTPLNQFVFVTGSKTGVAEAIVDLGGRTTSKDGYYVLGKRQSVFDVDLVISELSTRN